MRSNGTERQEEPVGSEEIPATDAAAVIAVLAEAFADYPVMRYVLGEAYTPARLHRLITFFVMARALRGHPMLGVRDRDGGLVAVATVTPPEPGDEPAELEAVRSATWAELGDEARERYAAYGRATAPFGDGRPHHHINMIGVRRPDQGRGLARPLLEAVHRLAHRHPGSAGVSLTTEVPANLSFYEHFGYRRVGHARVAPMLETWGLFREVRP